MTEKKVLGLFPGQGSQQVGMGKDFVEALPLAKDLFDVADKALGFSLSEICFDGPIEKLTATQFVQPAILTVSTICYRAFLGAHPDLQVVAAAGHSLGEYSALVAAEALTFEEAVQLVHKRGRYMQEAVAVGEGKMVAVLGKELAEIDDALAKVTVGSCVQIANINAPGQVVVSGLQDAVNEFLEILGAAKTVVLAVSAPFHCDLMEPAAQKLVKDLDKTTISEAKFPIYCNVTGKAVSQPEEIREALKKQVCGSVRWVECMENALSDVAPQEAIEFGAGSVLCNLLKRINKEVPRYNVGSFDALVPPTTLEA
jgi:[acyl-carrier-protein] S-malonyltransferase